MRTELNPKAPLRRQRLTLGVPPSRVEGVGYSGVTPGVPTLPRPGLLRTLPVPSEPQTQLRAGLRAPTPPGMSTP